jgi:hypothetical protein
MTSHTIIEANSLRASSRLTAEVTAVHIMLPTAAVMSMP